MLSHLISTPSISSKDPKIDQSNKGVIDLIAQWLSDIGFSIEIIPSIGAEDKFNLIASYGSGEGGLILSGHSDTVPFDEDRWSGDPLKLRDIDGRWYGLGVSDMKCFFPIAIEALKRVGLNRIEKPVYIVATADEESTMSGIYTLYNIKKPSADYVVIGEPTGLKPIRMNKGIMMESIKVIGVDGHSSDPERGRNAIEGMWFVMEGLMRWRKNLKDKYNNPSFSVPHPTLNFGRIHGGDSPNRICPICELQIDIRLNPGMDIEDVRTSIGDLVSEVIENKGFSSEIKPLFIGTPAMDTPEHSSIVKASEELTGYRSGAVMFATEGYFFNKMGMETIILGPGNIEVAHRPDEYLEVSNIEPALNIYSSLIDRFCCHY